MLTVHHLESSRSFRVLWLLEELGLEYTVRRHTRDEEGLARADLTAPHPLGKAPVLCDGDLVIAESGAIIEYLVGVHGKGRLAPDLGTPEWTRYQYWLHAAEGTVMPLLSMKLVFARVEARAPFVVRPVARRVGTTYIDPNLTRVLDLMESTLERTTWFAGDDLTAADIQMGYPVEAAAARVDLASRHPRLCAFLERARARPAYRAAIEKGGSFSILTA